MDLEAKHQTVFLPQLNSEGEKIPNIGSCLSFYHLQATKISKSNIIIETLGPQPAI